MDQQADLVARARTGDSAAVDELVRGTTDLVYNLSIRMLGSPVDAEDATQEILMKLVTNLGSFRGDSTFRTWAYRVASNHLLTTRKRGAEHRVESFDDLGEKLANNLSHDDPPVDDQVLIQEAMQICTSLMLVCLDRDHRLAFILGEIFEVASDDAAEILEIAPDAFRKRLSRARERMAAFTSTSCGLVDAANVCRCAKQGGHGVKVGTIDPTCLTWPRSGETRKAHVAALDAISRAVEMFRGHSDLVPPAALVRGIRRALDTGELTGHDFRGGVV